MKGVYAGLVDILFLAQTDRFLSLSVILYRSLYCIYNSQVDPMVYKRKSLSHLIDRQAINTIERILPDFWTIREYRPDYGIDLAIEIFEKPAEETKSSIYETLGEHFFVQVKGKEKIKITSLEVKKRDNVEKGKLKESSLFKKIDVIKFQIEISELCTIQRMSNVVPTFLFLVDTSNDNIYFLNLNDYIDKVIIPKDQNYESKKYKTLYIPASNIITREFNTLYPLMFYSKRPKFYSFFNKVRYQFNELSYVAEDGLTECLGYFSKVLLTLDVWDCSWMWPLFDKYKKAFFNFINNKELGLMNYTIELDDSEASFDTAYSFGKKYTQKKAFYYMELRQLWEGMSKLYNVYEEICREFFLPTMMGELLRKFEESSVLGLTSDFSALMERKSN